MVPYKLEPFDTYVSQITQQLKWWKAFRNEVVDQMDDAQDYDTSAKLQMDHKRAEHKILQLEYELRKCNAAAV